MKGGPYGRGVGMQRHERRIWQCLSWLLGIDSTASRADARLFAALLPAGVQKSSCEAVAQAAWLAASTYSRSASSVARFIFSILTAQDDAKAAAVMDSLISVSRSREVPALVRTAVMTRPRLAATIVRVAMARVPAEAASIWSAAESVVVGLQPFEATRNLSSLQ